MKVIRIVYPVPTPPKNNDKTYRVNITGVNGVVIVNRQRTTTKVQSNCALHR